MGNNGGIPKRQEWLAPPWAQAYRGYRQCMSLSQLVCVLSKPSEALRGLGLLIVGPEHELSQSNAVLDILQILQLKPVHQQPYWLCFAREARRDTASLQLPSQPVACVFSVPKILHKPDCLTPVCKHPKGYDRRLAIIQVLGLDTVVDLAQALFVAVNATWVVVCGLAILRLNFTGLQWLTIDVALDVFPC